MEQNNANEIIQTQEVTQEQTIETPSEQLVNNLPKEKKMDLKTLFLLGLGTVAIIVVIIIIIMNLVGKKVVVKFDTDGGSKINSVEVKKGKKVSKPKNPTKEDYTFVEWQLDGKKYDFNKAVEKSMTLKAKWEVLLTDEVYTITFDTRGGDEIESQEINGNGQVIKPEDPTKPHYKFVEWQLNGEKYDFDSLVKEEITLVAKWEALPSHTVLIDFDGAGNNYSQVVYEGDLLEEPNTPKKTGYKFLGWEKAGVKYNFETPVVEDFTIKATYEEVPTFVVTFDTDKGSFVETQKVEQDSVVVKPKDPTKEGYTFAGWQLDGQDYDMNTPVTKDITLKAKWNKAEEAKKCEVKIFAFSDGLISTINVPCGSKITASQINSIAKEKCPTMFENYPNLCKREEWSWHYCDDCTGENPEKDKYDFNKPVTTDIKIGAWFGMGSDVN